MSAEIRTTVEVVIYGTLTNGEAMDLTKAISRLVDEYAGRVNHTVKAVAPPDQTWEEMNFEVSMS